MDANKTPNSRSFYGQQLANNIQEALPQAKIEYFGGNVYLYLSQAIGEKASLKGWLYTLLESLPEIDQPLERIQFVVYENNALKLISVINPSKFEVTALDKAIGRGLDFSAPPPAAWELEPLPLNHPYYTEEGWLKNQQTKSKKDKQVTFDDVKDLPNVKPILDQIRKDGIDF